MNKVTLIADNGGGFTLQVVNGCHTYEHCYDYVTEQTAKDVLNAINDGDTTDWEGNSAIDNWLVPTQQEVDNGGYRIFEVGDTCDCQLLLNWGIENSWMNIREFCEFLRGIIK